MYKAYKYRLYPTKEQKEYFEKNFGCVRFVYNWALAKKKEVYEAHKANPDINIKQSLSKFEISKMLPALKTEKEWLKEANSQALVSAIEHLDIAYKNFFQNVKTNKTRNKGFPKFKSKKKNHFSFACSQNTTMNFKTQRLNVLKCPNIKIILHRPFFGTIKTTTISKTPNGQYFASILVNNNIQEKPLQSFDANKTIGIDVGIKNMIICSNGIKFDNEHFFKKEERRLAFLQKRHAKKQIQNKEIEVNNEKKAIKDNSKNREKSRLKIAKLHQKIKNKRLYYIHHITHTLTNESQISTIFVEDLNVKGMMKNHRLSKSLSDVSIGIFNDILEYKCRWAGINFMKIDRFEPSSQRCSICNTINKKVKNLNVREWTCSNCDTIHDRDLNASINIKNIGITSYLPECIREVKSVECPLVDDRSSSVMSLKSNGMVKQKKRVV